MEMTTSGGRTTIVLRHRDRHVGFIAGALGLFTIWDEASAIHARHARPATVAPALSPFEWPLLLLAVVVEVAVVAFSLWAFVFIVLVKEVLTIDQSGVTMQLKVGSFGISTRRFVRAADIANASIDEYSRRGRGHLYAARRIRLDGPGCSARTRISVSREDGEAILRGPLAAFVRA